MIAEYEALVKNNDKLVSLPEESASQADKEADENNASKKIIVFEKEPEKTNHE